MKNIILKLLPWAIIILFNAEGADMYGQISSKPGSRLNKLEFDGNKKFSTKVLQNWFDLKRHALIDESDFYQRCLRVLDKFKQSGYYFAKIDSVHFAYNQDSSLVNIQVNLKEGDLLEINELKLTGLPEADKSVILELRTKAGGVFNQGMLQEDIEYILSYFENKGYPYCQVSIAEFKFENSNIHAKSKVNIELYVNPGAQVSIADIEIRGNEETKDYVIKRELGIRSGDIYNQRRIDKIQPQLMKSGYFKWVNPPILEWQKNGEGKVIIELAEGNNNRFNGVIGYNPASGTSKGFVTGLVDISFRNLLGTGRQIEAHWERRTEKTQQLQLQYLEPWIGGLPLNAGMSFEQIIQDTSYVQRNFGLNFSLLFNPNLSIFTRMTKKDISPDSLGAILFGIPPSSSLNLSVGFTFNTLNHLLNPTRGILYQTSFEWGRKQVDEVANQLTDENMTGSFNQKTLSIDLESYFSTFRWQVFSIALHGRQITSNEDEIPLPDQFRFGGNRNLRGYREEQFRGSRIAWSNIEYRFLIGRNSRFFLFLDTGYYFRKETVLGKLVEIEDAKVGYGIGLRIETKLGFFGIDYGLGEGDGLSNGKIHIGLTNAF